MVYHSAAIPPELPQDETAAGGGRGEAHLTRCFSIKYGTLALPPVLYAPSSPSQGALARLGILHPTR